MEKWLKYGLISLLISIPYGFLAFLFNMQKALATPIILGILFFIIGAVIGIKKDNKEQLAKEWLVNIIKFNGLIGIFMGFILIFFIPIGWGFNVGIGLILIIISVIIFVTELIRKKKPYSKYKIRLIGLVGIFIGISVLLLMGGEGLIILHISFLILFIDIIIDIIKGFFRKIF